MKKSQSHAGVQRTTVCRASGFSTVRGTLVPVVPGPSLTLLGHSHPTLTLLCDSSSPCPDTSSQPRTMLSSHRTTKQGPAQRPGHPGSTARGPTALPEVHPEPGPESAPSTAWCRPKRNSQPEVGHCHGRWARTTHPTDARTYEPNPQCMHTAHSHTQHAPTGMHTSLHVDTHPHSHQHMHTPAPPAG